MTRSKPYYNVLVYVWFIKKYLKTCNLLLKPASFIVDIQIRPEFKQTGTKFC